MLQKDKWKDMGLGLEAIGVPCDDRGRIEVDENPEHLPRMSAMLGEPCYHKAEEEGVSVAEFIC